MPEPWLRSRGFDLTFFLGPALLSLVLVGPALLGYWPDLDTPLWAWLVLVLGVDVAHVWTTLYRVYLDPDERRRRPGLYFGVPVAVFLLSMLLYAVNPAWFWTALAYVAVHHFVKQQIGFVALYRHRAGDRVPLSRTLDNAAIYAGTLIPVAWWHVNLPRNFAWFMPGDFLGPWPRWVMDVLWPVYLGVALAWLGRRLWQVGRGGGLHPGRDLTMAATWAVWFVGIVALNGDFAFTVTNVLIHGIPYMALVWHVTERAGGDHRAVAHRFARSGVAFVGLVLALAFVEEGLWDALVWREHERVFGSWRLPASEALLIVVVPLLTVPQATHYVLDGFIWRLDGSNPGLRERLFTPPARAEAAAKYAR